MNLTIDNDTCHEIIFIQGGVSHSLDKLYYNEHLVWEKPSQHDYSQDYFTIESLENECDITISYTIGEGLEGNMTLNYSKDNGVNWNTLTFTHTNYTKTLTLNNGEKALIRNMTMGDGIWCPLSSDTTGHMFINGTKRHIVYGNIMSMFYGSLFTDKTTIYYDACPGLFWKDEYLVDASNLIMPATTLTPECYAYMFRLCTSLTQAPVLPATTLASNCYQDMFMQCTSLTQAPVLPATTMEDHCYSGMFRGCTNLTQAPELPATTLATYCYNWMFEGCTNLTQAPELQATTLVNWCYMYMFGECTNLTQAPKLPATTLVKGCYASMFEGCTSLTTIKCNATDISASLCVSDWLDGVATTGTFYKNSSMSSWTTGISGIPSGWTVLDYA